MDDRRRARHHEVVRRVLEDPDALRHLRTQHRRALTGKEQRPAAESPDRRDADRVEIIGNPDGR
jgi:hypothetical protein